MFSFLFSNCSVWLPISTAVHHSSLFSHLFTSQFASWSCIISTSLFADRNVIKSSPTGLFQPDFNPQLTAGCIDGICAKNVVQFYPSNIQLSLSFQILHIIRSWTGDFKNLLYSWDIMQGTAKNYEMKNLSNLAVPLYIRYTTSFYITLLHVFKSTLSHSDTWVVTFLPRLHAQGHLLSSTRKNATIHVVCIETRDIWSFHDTDWQDKFGRKL